jgi:hypothetical protein
MENKVDFDVAVLMFKEKLISDANSSGLPITVLIMCVKELLEAFYVKQNEKIKTFKAKNIGGADDGNKANIDIQANNS